MTKKNNFLPTRRIPGNHQFPIALSDLMTVMVLVIWYMFAVAVINIAPKHQENAPPIHVPPGIVQTMITWPDVDTPGGCADIDLWMQSPYDNEPVGFAHAKDVMTNLLRDDIGCINNPLGKNFEIDQTHGVPAGEYVVNLHYFDNHSETIPIKIHVVIDVITENPAGTKTDTLILDKWVTMKSKNDAITVAVFNLDSQGKLIGLYNYPKDIVPQSVRNESSTTSTYNDNGSGNHR